MSKSLAQPFSQKAVKNKVLAGAAVAAVLAFLSIGAAGATPVPQPGNGGNGYGGGNTYVQINGNIYVTIINYFFK